MIAACRVHACCMLYVTCMLAACCLLHASHCLLPAAPAHRLLHTCCMLRAFLLHAACCVCFISKRCNRGRNAIYVPCFLYPISAACRMQQIACCVLLAPYIVVACCLLPLPVLLVPCHSLLAARYLPASAALWGDLPQSAQG